MRPSSRPSASSLAVAAAAAVDIASTPHGASALAGMLALLVASTIAERYPVPIHGIDTGGVSVSFVFCVSAIVLFGWAPGVIVSFAAPTIMQLWEHRPPVRGAYNASVFALSAGTGGLLVASVTASGTSGLLEMVALAAIAHYGVNMILICLVLAAGTSAPLLQTIRSSTRLTIVPFTLMGSAALILVVLWQRAPGLSLALIGPLVAIALYQRRPTASCARSGSGRAARPSGSAVTSSRSCFPAATRRGRNSPPPRSSIGSAAPRSSTPASSR